MFARSGVTLISPREATTICGGVATVAFVCANAGVESKAKNANRRFIFLSVKSLPALLRRSMRKNLHSLRAHPCLFIVVNHPYIHSKNSVVPPALENRRESSVPHYLVCFV